MYLPDGGQSESDLWPEEVRAARQVTAGAHNGSLPAPDSAVFGITGPDLVAWLQERWTPHPFACYTDPVPAGDARSMAIPRTYIYRTGGPATSAPLFAPFAAKARALGWPVFELAAGHVAVQSTPEDLAALLMKIST